MAVRSSQPSTAPASGAELAAALAEASSSGSSVRVAGAGTKRWGAPVEAEIELSTARLDRIVEHNTGDLTAVLEAGVPLRVANERFAEAGQMLALDPPERGGATIGGVVAAGDSGPLRARFGGPRDLVVGVSVALGDGTVAKAGGRVIKNVAGYDIAKLLTGSLGTLGAILELCVRLHPRPERTATAAAGSRDAGALCRAAAELAHAPLEPQSLDLRYGGGEGAVLARFGGAAATEGAEAARRILRRAGMAAEVVVDDERIWERQRDGQRSDGGAVVRVSALQSTLPAVLAAAGRLGARAVARAGLGIAWLRIEDRGPDDTAAAVEQLRRELDPAPCAVLDAPAEVRARVDPWGPVEPGLAALMRRVKERFDPAGVLAPGAFVAGI